MKSIVCCGTVTRTFSYGKHTGKGCFFDHSARNTFE
jgi:hypothetical protein